MNFSDISSNQSNNMSKQRIKADHKDTNIAKGRSCAMVASLKTCLGKTHPCEKP
jgi:hypothetical protein